jgi:photosystem II stability/assembly factor-like uncharacterized protein
MEFVVGTSSGVFVGKAGKSAEGVDGRSVRHLSQVGGDLFAGAVDGVYRSGDGGRSWKRSGIEGCDVWNILAAPEDQGTMYAGTQPAHMFRSSDGGGTWESFDAFLEIPGAERWCLPGGQTARALTLVIDPSDPQHFLAGVEVGGVVASEDGGKHWSLSLTGDNADLHVLVAHPQRKGVVFATTGHGRNDELPMNPRMAGLYRSEDGGKHWSYLGERMEPYYTRPICIDPRAPFALTLPTAPAVRSSISDPGGAQAVLFRSDDDGETWRSLGDSAHSPSAARLTAVTPDAERPGWVLVGTETGEVWRVSPGASWTKLTEGLPSVQALLSVGA